MSGTPPSQSSSAIGAWQAWLRSCARNPITWMVALAFGLRLSWVLLVPSRPVGDFALYRESAAYLWEHKALDPEFIYMPGYVALLALVQALGGGLLAAKMIGVVAGTVVAVAVGGIASSIGSRRSGVIAATVVAVWPAGIAVASVTGTDVPAAALIAVAVFALVRLAPSRPWLAAAMCGLTFGMAAWIRAVAAPLAAMSLLYWIAAGARPVVALQRTAIAVAVAFVVLVPWAVRNQRVYGELFFTDSHGGNTALVGANPNTEGTYSRSLNLMFKKATGYRALESTARHRASDRAAYALAKSWTAFEPAYTLGLGAAKADRLLTHERNLLYWPMYRQGVLAGDRRAFFDAHRAALERVVDGFWWVLAALSAAGVALCGAQRRWTALALLGFPLVLAAIYAWFFSEVRYHLAIAPLLFPYAAIAIDSLLSAAKGGVRDGGGDRRSLLWAVLATAALFGGWSALLAVGESLRVHHRWAVAVCDYPELGATHVCAWRRTFPVAGASPVRGVWDGVGLRIGSAVGDDVIAGAQTEIPLDPGRFRVSAVISLIAEAASGESTTATTRNAGVSVALRAAGRVIARVVLPATDAQSATPIAGVVDHTGGALVLEIEVEPGGIGSIVEPDGASGSNGAVDAGANRKTVWMSQLLVERFQNL